MHVLKVGLNFAAPNEDKKMQKDCITISGRSKGAGICSEVKASIPTSSFANFMSNRTIWKQKFAEVLIDPIFHLEYHSQAYRAIDIFMEEKTTLRTWKLIMNIHFLVNETVAFSPPSLEQAGVPIQLC